MLIIIEIEICFELYALDSISLGIAISGEKFQKMRMKYRPINKLLEMA